MRCGPGQDAAYEKVAALDEFISDLEKEARHNIYAATGVPWEIIVKANL